MVITAICVSALKKASFITFIFLISNTWYNNKYITPIDTAYGMLWFIPLTETMPSSAKDPANARLLSLNNRVA